MAAVIRKKAKAKHERERKEAKKKQYPKRSKKMLTAPQSVPHREELEAFVHESSAFLNDVIRPIESTRGPTKSANYSDQLSALRREILAKHREKVAFAKQSYAMLNAALTEADLVIEVLDARDPQSCRLLQAETGRPLLIVLNKIDLVPRDAVVRWVGTLRSVAPTIAIAANSPASALPALREAVESIAPAAARVAVIGIRGVGKSAICAMNPETLAEVSAYGFIAQTAEMGLLRGVDFIDPLYDLAIEILGRAADESFYIAIEVPVQESPEDVIKELAKRWQMKPRLAGQKFVEMFWTGDYRWFAVPDDTECREFTEAQAMALEASVPFELTAVSYIQLASGEHLSVDEQLLGTEPESDEGEEEEDGDEAG